MSTNDVNSYDEILFSKKDIARIIKSREMTEAEGKKNYWITCGCALLDNDDVLKQKWITFVEERINDFERGALVDETLQIMSLIKMNFPNNHIKDILEQMQSNAIVLDYLSIFISPESLDDIRPHVQIYR